MQNAKTKTVPIWISLLLILLCLSGGVWMVRWYLQTGGAARVELTVDPARVPDRPAFNPPQRRNRNRPPMMVDGIVKTSDTFWIVNSGNALMRVALAGGETQFNCIYKSPTYASPVHVQFRDMVDTILSKPEIAIAIKATPEQLDQLRAHQARIGIRMTDADRASLLNQWKEYIASAENAKPDLEKKLLTTLKDVAERSLPATRTALDERVAAIKAILTPEQIEAYNKL